MRIGNYFCILLLAAHLPAFAQLGSRQVYIFEDDSVKQNVKSRVAADARREQQAAQIIEQDRKRLEQAKREYAADRDAERSRIQQLPADAPGRDAELDSFECMYPLSASLPPNVHSVNNCMEEILSRREEVKRQAIEIKKRIFEEEQRVERERLDSEIRRVKEETLRIANQAAVAEKERARLYGIFIVTLSISGLIYSIYYRKNQGWLSITIALIFGALSGLIVYVMAGLVVAGKAAPITTELVVITFFGGWILSFHLLLERSITAKKVISRGFLLGAMEWFMMIPIVLFFAGKSATTTIEAGSGSSAEIAGAAIGGGLFAFLSGGVCIWMIVVCLIGYAVTYFINREMNSETPEVKIKCPECAELIQPEARKCRYCGAILLTAPIESLAK